MMKRFIVRALCFILPVLAGLTLGEYFLRQVPNDYSFKKEWLDHNSSQVEVLVLGSSHTYYGVNPVYFSKKSFNAAYVSQSIPYDYFIFTKYVNQMKNLSYVILPISYFSLWGSLENDGEAYRLKNYSIYYDCKYHKWYELSNQLELFDKKNLAKAAL